MIYKFKDLIIFEMANNHEGRLKHGLKIINEMSKISKHYGIKTAIKLQYRDLETFIHPDFVRREDVKHIPRFLQNRLSWEDFQTLVLNIHENGLFSVITPFDEKSVEMALNHGVDILKIASSSCMDWPLLEVIARASTPVICSTGGCIISDIDKIVTFFEHRNVFDFALLHCVGTYPTENKDQQLNFIKKMMVRYPQCSIGYSGHEAPDNLMVVRAVVAIGAQIFERHVGVPENDINLNAYSMNPEQVCKWIEAILETKQLCGILEEDKQINEIEKNSLLSLTRGVFAKRPIKKGELLSRESVFFAMPCEHGQTTTKQYLETMVASRAYIKNEAICENRILNSIQTIRSVVHEARGMLREAKIPIGKEYEVELSHHYGSGKIRKYGAIIVNYINREYCKKLIILLPGQVHPSHAHMRKEETFQILYGELDLILDNVNKKMFPGDIQLIVRGQYHAFSSQTGCIFEEISTTHIKGDSVYEDNTINTMDPIKRKTIIENW